MADCPFYVQDGQDLSQPGLEARYVLRHPPPFGGPSTHRAHAHLDWQTWTFPSRPSWLNASYWILDPSPSDLSSSNWEWEAQQQAPHTHFFTVPPLSFPLLSLFVRRLSSRPFPGRPCPSLTFSTSPCLRLSPSLNPPHSFIPSACQDEGETLEGLATRPSCLLPIRAWFDSKNGDSTLPSTLSTAPPGGPDVDPWPFQTLSVCTGIANYFPQGYVRHDFARATPATQTT